MTEVKCVCVCYLESPVLKWLCVAWGGAVSIALLAVPKLLLGTRDSSVDTQVGLLYLEFCGHIKGEVCHI